MPKRYEVLYLQRYDNDFDGLKKDDMIEIGKIVDKKKNDIAAIVYFPNAYNFFHSHMGFSIMNYGQPNQHYYVYFDDYLGLDMFYEAATNKRTQAILYSMFMHELSYIVNGDLDEVINSEEADIEAMKERADVFAVKEMGKNNFLLTLNYLRKKREKAEDDNVYIKMSALKEIDDRIQKVKEMK